MAGQGYETVEEVLAPEDLIKTNEITSHAPFNTHVSQCPRRIVLNTFTKPKPHNLNTKLPINVCNRIVM